MITDILTKALEMKIADKTYELEFDNNAYAALEMATGKGILQIYEAIIQGSLGFGEYIETMCCGLLKKHKKSEISSLKTTVESQPYLLIQNMPAICGAYIAPLTPPSIMQKVSKKK